MVKIESDYKPILLYSNKEGVGTTSVGSDGIILLDNDFKCDARTYYYVSSDIISTDILPLERVSAEIVDTLFTKQ